MERSPMTDSRRASQETPLIQFSFCFRKYYRKTLRNNADVQVPVHQVPGGKCSKRPPWYIFCSVARMLPGCFRGWLGIWLADSIKMAVAVARFGNSQPQKSRFRSLVSFESEFQENPRRWRLSAILISMSAMDKFEYHIRDQDSKCKCNFWIIYNQM